MNSLEIEVKSPNGFKLKFHIEDDTVKSLVEKLEFMTNYLEKKKYRPIDSELATETALPATDTFKIVEIRYGGKTKNRAADDVWKVISPPHDGFGDYGIVMYGEQWIESGLPVPGIADDLSRFKGWHCKHNGKKVVLIETPDTPLEVVKSEVSKSEIPKKG